MTEPLDAFADRLKVVERAAQRGPLVRMRRSRHSGQLTLEQQLRSSGEDRVSPGETARGPRQDGGR